MQEEDKDSVKSLRDNTTSAVGIRGNEIHVFMMTKGLKVYMESQGEFDFVRGGRNCFSATARLMTKHCLLKEGPGYYHQANMPLIGNATSAALEELGLPFDVTKDMYAADIIETIPFTVDSPKSRVITDDVGDVMIIHGGWMNHAIRTTWMNFERMDESRKHWTNQQLDAVNATTKVTYAGSAAFYPGKNSPIKVFAHLENPEGGVSTYSIRDMEYSALELTDVLHPEKLNADSESVLLQQRYLDILAFRVVGESNNVLRFDVVISSNTLDCPVNNSEFPEMDYRFLLDHTARIHPSYHYCTVASYVSYSETAPLLHQDIVMNGSHEQSASGKMLN